MNKSNYSIEENGKIRYFEIELKEITPEFADTILENSRARGNAGRIQTSVANIKRYSNFMNAGLWSVNGTMVILSRDEDGNDVVEDGTTRLEACAKTRKPFKTFVLRELNEAGEYIMFDRTALSTLDQGKLRTKGDAFKVYSGINSPNLELKTQTVRSILNMKIEKEEIQARLETLKKRKSKLSKSDPIYKKIEKEMTSEKNRNDVASLISRVRDTIREESEKKEFLEHELEYDTAVSIVNILQDSNKSSNWKNSALLSPKFISTTVAYLLIKRGRVNMVDDEGNPVHDIDGNEVQTIDKEFAKEVLAFFEDILLKKEVQKTIIKNKGTILEEETISDETVTVFKGQDPVSTVVRTILLEPRQQINKVGRKKFSAKLSAYERMQYICTAWNWKHNKKGDNIKITDERSLNNAVGLLKKSVSQTIDFDFEV